MKNFNYETLIDIILGKNGEPIPIISRRYDTLKVEYIFLNKFVFWKKKVKKYEN